MRMPAAPRAARGDGVSGGAAARGTRTGGAVGAACAWLVRARARRALAHLEDPEDAHEPDDAEDGEGAHGAGAALVVARPRLLPRRRRVERALHEEGQDRHEVDPVHHAEQERAPRRRGGEAQQQLEREADDGDDLGGEPRLLPRRAVLLGHEVVRRHREGLAVELRLEAEGDCRDGDDQQRELRVPEGRGRERGRLEAHPHPVLQRHQRVRRQHRVHGLRALLERLDALGLRRAGAAHLRDVLRRGGACG